MKFAAVLALLGVACAQITFNNGSISCAIANGTYCAGANIIIRCTNGIGQAGNCDDNLDGEPPVGLSYAPCFDCGANSGKAACSKAGIVYPSSGTGLGSTPFAANASSAVCNATTTSSTNATTPGGPIVNTTSSPSGAASPTGGYAGPTSTPSTLPYTGAATSVQIMSAGAVVGFGALFAALGML